MIPGFIEGILGMKINDEKILKCQFPKDYPKDFLEEKVKKGELGVKSGKGFYDYS